MDHNRWCKSTWIISISELISIEDMLHFYVILRQGFNASNEYIETILYAGNIREIFYNLYVLRISISIMKEYIAFLHDWWTAVLNYNSMGIKSIRRYTCHKQEIFSEFKSPNYMLNRELPYLLLHKFEFLYCIFSFYLYYKNGVLSSAWWFQYWCRHVGYY